jgi:hypothetical protein
LVSTVICDGTSKLARLTRSFETGVPFEEVESAPSMFVTNIFRCDRNGFAGRIDDPLHEAVYGSVDAAREGHRRTVALLAEGKLKFAPPESD